MTETSSPGGQSAPVDGRPGRSVIASEHAAHASPCGAGGGITESARGGRMTGPVSRARGLRPTLTHTRRQHYLRPGGPWRVGSLDDVLSSPKSSRHRIHDGSTSLNAVTIESAVADLAGRLRKRGVRRGDPVAWQLPNCVAAMLLSRACWRLGAVAVPIHMGAGERDVGASLDQVPARFVLAAPNVPAAEIAGAHVVHGLESLLDALPAAPPVAPSSSARPTDLAVVIFTSGSTGRPKAVLHTQRALAWKARSMIAIHGLRSDDVVLMPAPMAHISGLFNGIILPAAAGMGTVPMARWDPGQALALIEEERVSFMIGPPTFFVTLVEADRFARERVKTLRLVSAGGATVTPAFVEMAEATLGCVVKRTYGSTEAPTLTTSFVGDDPERARATEGRAVGEVELRVSDPASGRAMAPGEVGELWVRGPELFVGYVDPADTAPRIGRGGWFRTADLATLDEDRWLRIVGRVSDTIIRGGENISASEVQLQLESHPWVSQAAVVPFPDPVMGERVAAVVVARQGFDLGECRRWFAERGIAKFKTPERVVLLASLPTLASGKVDRAACRERARSGGAASQQPVS